MTWRKLWWWVVLPWLTGLGNMWLWVLIFGAPTTLLELALLLGATAALMEAAFILGPKEMS